MYRTTQKKRGPWRGAKSLRKYSNWEIRAASSGWRYCLRQFSIWLEKERELSLSTIRVRLASTRRFVDGLGGSEGVGGLKHLTACDVEDFLIAYSENKGPSETRSMQAAMRLFLRFAESRGWVGRGLSDAVVSLRSYRHSSIPRGFSDETVRTLVAASAERSARDHAIVLMLAIYGVRRGQVSGLRLGDIDWTGKSITFRPHKSGKMVQHELVPAVAAPLAQYLRNERPRTSEQTVFLRSLEPYLPLAPGAVTEVVVRLARRVGLEPCRPSGAHGFRHAFASRLLRSGRSHKVIADLLGHRSLDAVSIYAKVDHPRLLEVASDWPEVVS